jgi:maleamate amidohydrolase
VSENRRAVALVLVDVINAFFHRDGAFHYEASAEVVPGLRRLLEAARRGGRLVVHAREAHHPGLDDFETGKLPAHCAVGSFDAEFVPGIEPVEGEIEIPKRRFSAFFATDLALLLGEQGVRRVVVAGAKTNVCVRATVQDAFANGFDPVVVRGTANSNRPHLHEATLEDIDLYFGTVIDLEEGERLLLGEGGDDG